MQSQFRYQYNRGQLIALLGAFQTSYSAVMLEGGFIMQGKRHDAIQDIGRCTVKIKNHKMSAFIRSEEISEANVIRFLQTVLTDRNNTEHLLNAYEQAMASLPLFLLNSIAQIWTGPHFSEHNLEDTELNQVVFTSRMSHIPLVNTFGDVSKIYGYLAPIIETEFYLNPQNKFELVEIRTNSKLFDDFLNNKFRVPSEVSVRSKENYDAFIQDLIQKYPEEVTLSSPRLEVKPSPAREESNKWEHPVLIEKEEKRIRTAIAKLDKAIQQLRRKGKELSQRAITNTDHKKGSFLKEDIQTISTLVETLDQQKNSLIDIAGTLRVQPNVISRSPAARKLRRTRVFEIYDISMAATQSASTLLEKHHYRWWKVVGGNILLALATVSLSLWYGCYRGLTGHVWYFFSERNAVSRVKEAEVPVRKLRQQYS